LTGKPPTTIKSILKAARHLIERGVYSIHIERTPTGDEIYAPNDVMTKFYWVDLLDGIENYPAHEDEADKPSGNWLGRIPSSDGQSESLDANAWSSLFHPSYGEE
jgi:hypothetical protein